MIEIPAPPSNDPAVWRRATLDDLPAIMAVQDEVHTLLPERPEVFAAKMRLFGEGCFVLDDGRTCVGYGIAHPWLLGEAPALDVVMGELPPAPDCLFVHDVALRRTARGRGAGRTFVDHATRIARDRTWSTLALISVYETTPLWARYGFRPAPLPAHKLAPYGDTARYMTAALA